jgi:hypothetical protein
MRSSPGKPFLSIALIAALAALLSGWTCSGMFVSCQGVSQAHITSILPGKIPSDANSVPLTVAGSGFTPQSQIMWNGSTLETTFLDSHHLQTTITRDTFESFGGGNRVRISVSQGSGCPIGGNAALDLAIN